jgi:hypothetical protein
VRGGERVQSSARKRAAGVGGAEWERERKVGLRGGRCGGRKAGVLRGEWVGRSGCGGEGGSGA